MPFYSRLAKIGATPELEAIRQRTIGGVQRLRSALSKHILENRRADFTGATVRIATWNIREFGGTKSGGRGLEDLHYIAEIIAHFDVVALQEVRGNLSQFGDLTRILGPDWDHLATDVTDGDAGNGERMVFLFNRRKAQFTNIAGELTLATGQKVTAFFGERILLGPDMRLKLPPGTDFGTEHNARMESTSSGFKLDRDIEWPIPPGASLELPDGCSLALVKNTPVEKISAGRARIDVPTPTVSNPAYRLRFPGGSIDDSFKQFARTPYLVSLQSGWLKVNLCTVHIYFGDSDDPQMMEQRRAEIQALTDLLGARAKAELKADPENRTFTAVMGDFNIMRHDHVTMQALENSGFKVDDRLKAIPGSNVEKDKAYDQIAFWEPERQRGYAKLEVVGAGVFDYFEQVYRMDEAATYRPDASASAYKQWRTYKMSDHLPMWIELRNDFSEEYLAASAALSP